MDKAALEAGGERESPKAPLFNFSIWGMTSRPPVGDTEDEAIIKKVSTDESTNPSSSVTEEHETGVELDLEMLSNAVVPAKEVKMEKQQGIASKAVAVNDKSNTQKKGIFNLFAKAPPVEKAAATKVKANDASKVKTNDTSKVKTNNASKVKTNNASKVKTNNASKVNDGVAGPNTGTVGGSTSAAILDILKASEKDRKVNRSSSTTEKPNNEKSNTPSVVETKTAVESPTSTKPTSVKEFRAMNASARGVTVAASGVSTPTKTNPASPATSKAVSGKGIDQSDPKAASAAKKSEQAFPVVSKTFTPPMGKSIQGKSGADAVTVAAVAAIPSGAVVSKDKAVVTNKSPAIGKAGGGSHKGKAAKSPTFGPLTEIEEGYDGFDVSLAAKSDSPPSEIVQAPAPLTAKPTKRGFFKSHDKPVKEAGVKSIASAPSSPSPVKEKPKVATSTVKPVSEKKSTAAKTSAVGSAVATSAATEAATSSARAEKASKSATVDVTLESGAKRPVAKVSSGEGPRPVEQVDASSTKPVSVKKVAAERSSSHGAAVAGIAVSAAAASGTSAQATTTAEPRKGVNDSRSVDARKDGSTEEAGADPIPPKRGLFGYRSGAAKSDHSVPLKEGKKEGKTTATTPATTSNIKSAQVPSTVSNSSSLKVVSKEKPSQTKAVTEGHAEAGTVAVAEAGSTVSSAVANKDKNGLTSNTPKAQGKAKSGSKLRVTDIEEGDDGFDVSLASKPDTPPPSEPLPTPAPSTAKSTKRGFFRSHDKPLQEVKSTPSAPLPTTKEAAIGKASKKPASGKKAATTKAVAGASAVAATAVAATAVAAATRSSTPVARTPIEVAPKAATHESGPKLPVATVSSGEHPRPMEQFDSATSKPVPLIERVATNASEGAVAVADSAVSEAASSSQLSQTTPITSDISDPVPPKRGFFGWLSGPDPTDTSIKSVSSSPNEAVPMPDVQTLLPASSPSSTKTLTQSYEKPAETNAEVAVAGANGSPTTSDTSDPLPPKRSLFGWLSGPEPTDTSIKSVSSSPDEAVPSPDVQTLLPASSTSSSKALTQSHDKPAQPKSGGDKVAGVVAVAVAGATAAGAAVSEPNRPASNGSRRIKVPNNEAKLQLLDIEEGHDGFDISLSTKPLVATTSTTMPTPIPSSPSKDASPTKKEVPADKRTPKPVPEKQSTTMATTGGSVEAASAVLPASTSSPTAKSRTDPTVDKVHNNSGVKASDAKVAGGAVKVKSKDEPGSVDNGKADHHTPKRGLFGRSKTETHDKKQLGTPAPQIPVPSKQGKSASAKMPTTEPKLASSTVSQSKEAEQNARGRHSVASAAVVATAGMASVAAMSKDTSKANNKTAMSPRKVTVAQETDSFPKKEDARATATEGKHNGFDASLPAEPHGPRTRSPSSVRSRGKSSQFVQARDRTPPLLDEATMVPASGKKSAAVKATAVGALAVSAVSRTKSPGPSTSPTTISPKVQKIMRAARGEDAEESSPRAEPRTVNTVAATKGKMRPSSPARTQVRKDENRSRSPQPVRVASAKAPVSSKNGKPSTATTPQSPKQVQAPTPKSRHPSSSIPTQSREKPATGGRAVAEKSKTSFFGKNVASPRKMASSNPASPPKQTRSIFKKTPTKAVDPASPPARKHPFVREAKGKPIRHVKTEGADERRQHGRGRWKSSVSSRTSASGSTYDLNDKEWKRKEATYGFVEDEEEEYGCDALCNPTRCQVERTSSFGTDQTVASQQGCNTGCGNLLSPFQALTKDGTFDNGEDDDSVVSVSDETIQDVQYAITTLKKHAERLGVSEKELMVALEEHEGGHLKRPNSSVDDDSLFDDDSSSFQD